MEVGSPGKEDHLPTKAFVTAREYSQAQGDRNLENPLCPMTVLALECSKAAARGMKVAPSPRAIIETAMLQSQALVGCLS